MTDLEALLAEGKTLLAEAKPEVKSVEVVHFPPDPENPLTHKSHVRYQLGKHVHHYDLHTMEHPKDAGSHTVHMTNPAGEPLVDAEGKYEPPLHLQQISKKDFKTHGGDKLHMLMVKNFTDRLHPTETNRKD